MQELRDNGARRPCDHAGRSGDAKGNQESMSSTRSSEEAREALLTP